MAAIGDQIILLTGASSGIGRATALKLAAQGASLFLTDIAAEALEATAKEAAAAGATVEFKTSDVSQESDAMATVAACVEHFGRLDGLCNIAGVIQFEHAEKTSFEMWRRILSVNLDGTFLMVREALPHLVETKGVIVNMGSTAGLMGLSYGAAYGASKGGVHALTRSVAVEYAQRGIRCNSVCPASIETAMSRPRFPKGIDMNLLNRAASLHGTRPPEVVANLVAFLLSDDAEHISGEEIRIDGAALA